MTPLEAIAAGTSDAARCMGLGDETGAIAEGLSADLLLVDGDPLTDVRILEDRARLRLIMKDGVVFKTDLPDGLKATKGSPVPFSTPTA